MIAMATHAPTRIAPSFREKVWGSMRLAPWFRDSETKVGEVWFDLQSDAFPILTKFIFTSERLSVQVHPNDEYAARHENSRGKTEMWHILRADPGAQIALGLKEAVSRDRLREASESGEIMGMLNWTNVRAGQCIFVPAGTIHAIGAGLALAEIQQQSDATYRLYDYGRPRELHLDKGVAVSSLQPYTPVAAPEGFLARCPYFAAQELSFESPTRYELETRREHLLIAIEGGGILNAHAFGPGEVWHVPAGAEPFPVEPRGALRMIRTCVP